MKKRLSEDRIAGSIRRANTGLSVGLYAESVRELQIFSIHYLKHDIKEEEMRFYLLLLPCLPKAGFNLSERSSSII